MSTIDIYQGDSRTLSLYFCDDNGVPTNMSGNLVNFVAKRSYTECNANALINKIVTGDASSVSGIMYIPLTTGDTSICVGSYLAGFRVIDLSTGVSTFDTDGLNILPSPMGTS